MNSRSHCSARSRSAERPSGSTNTVESVFAQGALHPIVSDHQIMADTSPIFFWRETHPRWGWLSQWYECEFEYDGRFLPALVRLDLDSCAQRDALDARDCVCNSRDVDDDLESKAVQGRGQQTEDTGEATRHYTDLTSYNTSQRILCKKCYAHAVPKNIKLSAGRWLTTTQRFGINVRVLESSPSSCLRLHHSLKIEILYGRQGAYR